MVILAGGLLNMPTAYCRLIKVSTFGLSEGSRIGIWNHQVDPGFGIHQAARLVTWRRQNAEGSSIAARVIHPERRGRRSRQHQMMFGVVRNRLSISSFALTSLTGLHPDFRVDDDLGTYIPTLRENILEDIVRLDLFSFVLGRSVIFGPAGI